jgi:hypothetical protein
MRSTPSVFGSISLGGPSGDPSQTASFVSATSATFRLRKSTRQLRSAVGAIRQQSASAGVTGLTGPSPTVIEGLLASGATGRAVVVASVRGSQRVDDAVGKC